MNRRRFATIALVQMLRDALNLWLVVVLVLIAVAYVVAFVGALVWMLIAQRRFFNTLREHYPDQLPRHMRGRGETPRPRDSGDSLRLLFNPHPDTNVEVHRARCVQMFGWTVGLTLLFPLVICVIISV